VVSERRPEGKVINQHRIVKYLTAHHGNRFKGTVANKFLLFFLHRMQISKNDVARKTKRENIGEIKGTVARERVWLKWHDDF
jgi:hypothetical protein